MIDIHTHVLPRVDDGPETLVDSRRALTALEESGVTTVVATPHLPCSLLESPRALAEYLDHSDRAWHLTAADASESALNLRLRRGYELMLDRPKPDLSDVRLRISRTRFVLVEFPFPAIPPRSEEAIRRILDGGLLVVIGHAERYSNLDDGMDLVYRWREEGAYLQVSTGSLMGENGRGSRQAAWTLLEQGHAHYLASDYHGRGGVPSGWREALRMRGAEPQLHQLTVANSELLLADQAPADVTAVAMAKSPWWIRPIPGLG